jgi:hypothetical protein
MALDYYVDSVSGDDGTGTGASGSPWKTIAKAISALATPVVDTTTIHLIGTLANPQTYDAANFVGVQCLGGAAVILKPDIFNISNYAQGIDPFGSSGSLNPTGAKPVLLQGIMSPAISFRQGSSGVVCLGLELTSPPTIGFMGSVTLKEASSAALFYSRVKEAGTGLAVEAASTLAFENGHLLNNIMMGAYCLDRGELILSGDNTFTECGNMGVYLYHNSSLLIKPSDSDPRKYFTSLFETLSPRLKYKAIWAAGNSVVNILDLTEVTNMPLMGYLKILNRNLYDSPNYIGIVLEGRSLLLNAKNISFSDPAINQGLPTVPVSQQIVAAADEDCTVVE